MPLPIERFDDCRGNVFGCAERNPRAGLECRYEFADCWNIRERVCAPAEVRRQLDQVSRAGQPYGSCMHVAMALTYLGDRDSAFAMLDRCVKERDGGLIILGVTPEWRELRGDPRFAALLRRVGVVDPARAH